MMNRRNFLAAVAAAPFTPAMFGRATKTKRRVVVVGGGLAGLSCAYELRGTFAEAAEKECCTGILRVLGMAQDVLCNEVE